MDRLKNYTQFFSEMSYLKLIPLIKDFLTNLDPTFMIRKSGNGTYEFTEKADNGLVFEIKALDATKLESEEDITCMSFTKMDGAMFRYHDIFEKIKDHLLHKDSNNIITKW
jgi:hypothetical protein